MEITQDFLWTRTGCIEGVQIASATYIFPKFHYLKSNHDFCSASSNAFLKASLFLGTNLTLYLCGTLTNCV